MNIFFTFYGPKLEWTGNKNQKLILYIFYFNSKFSV